MHKPPTSFFGRLRKPQQVKTPLRNSPTHAEIRDRITAMKKSFMSTAPHVVIVEEDATAEMEQKVDNSRVYAAVNATTESLLPKLYSYFFDGYQTQTEDIATLLTMLKSCARAVFFEQDPPPSYRKEATAHMWALLSLLTTLVRHYADYLVAAADKNLFDVLLQCYQVQCDIVNECAPQTESQANDGSTKRLSERIAGVINTEVFLQKMADFVMALNGIDAVKVSQINTVVMALDPSYFQHNTDNSTTFLNYLSMVLHNKLAKATFDDINELCHLRMELIKQVSQVVLSSRATVFTANIVNLYKTCFDEFDNRINLLSQAHLKTLSPAKKDQQLCNYFNLDTMHLCLISAVDKMSQYNRELAQCVIDLLLKNFTKMTQQYSVAKVLQLCGISYNNMQRYLLAQHPRAKRLCEAYDQFLQVIEARISQASPVDLIFTISASGASSSRSKFLRIETNIPDADKKLLAESADGHVLTLKPLMTSDSEQREALRYAPCVPEAIVTFRWQQQLAAENRRTART